MARSLPCEILWHNPGFSNKDTYNPPTVGRANSSRTQALELPTCRTKYRGPLVIHVAAKIDADDARHFGLNPKKPITGAFVGVAILGRTRERMRDG